MNPGELEILVALMRSVNPETVIEFGCNNGRTAAVILRNIPSIKTYVGVDVPVGYVTEKLVQRKEIPARPGEHALGEPRFKLEVRPRGTLDMTPADLPVADAIFIDGDHSYRVVDHDTRLAENIVRPGGIVIWHDYHDLGTVDVREFLHDYADRGSVVWSVEGTWLAFRRFE